MCYDTTRYFLAKHTHMCVANGHAVLLDLQNDNYLTFSHSESEILQATVVRRPAPSIKAASPRTDAALGEEPLLATLCRDGVLTRNEPRGKDAHPLSIDTPQTDFRSLQLRGHTVPRSHVARFIQSFYRTTLLMRLQSFEFYVTRVMKLRTLRPILSNPRELPSLVASYATLQPYFFSSYDKCLKNSLTMIDFLARFGAYPTFIIGVHMSPLTAHSWVQYGPLVLTDTVDQVRPFTPILIV